MRQAHVTPIVCVIKHSDNTRESNCPQIMDKSHSYLRLMRYPAREYEDEGTRFSSQGCKQFLKAAT